MEPSFRSTAQGAVVAAWERWNTAPKLKNLTIGGLTLVVLLWVAKRFAEDQTNALWDWLKRGVVALPWRALGLFFGALFIWLLVLAGVLAALVGVELLKRLRQARTKDVQAVHSALDAERAKVAATEAALARHVHVTLYGR